LKKKVRAKSRFLTEILNRSDLDSRDDFSKKKIYPNNCVFLPTTETLNDWKSTGSVPFFNFFQKLWILVSKILKWGKRVFLYKLEKCKIVKSDI
jgi:hypothetical protein